MPPPTPIVDAAAQLVVDLAACLEANGLPVPADRGVVFCSPCIKPGCCDLLVAVVGAPTIRSGCVAADWDLTVWWGTCYQPCTVAGPASDWLTAQEALARLVEQVITALTTCNACDPCPLVVSIDKFCDGGCAGVKIVYRLAQL